MVYAVVGSGGKTSLIKKMAKEFCAEGKKVFVTTSTKMYIEDDTVLGDEPDVIIRELEEKGYVMAGIPVGEKIGELSYETFLKVCKCADEVLIEADGSKHMPIKYPNETEPVIYDNVEQIIVVTGLHALNKPFKDVSFRLELVKECLGVDDNDIVTKDHIVKLVQKAYVEPLSKKYPDKDLIAYASHKGLAFERLL